MNEVEQEKPEVKTEIMPEALQAAGQSCLALGKAIESLLQKSMIDEARDLVDQLRLTCKAIRGSIRENRYSNQGIFSDINTAGIQLNKDAPVCSFIRGFLSEGEQRAVDVIQKAVARGFTKNQVFKAKEVLDLKSMQKRNNKWWSLPQNSSGNTDPQQ